MIKITNFFRLVLLINFMLLMTNCATEEINGNSSTLSKSNSEVRKWYDAHKSDYNAPILKYVEDLQWDKAIVSDGNIGEVIEVPFKLNGSIGTSNKNGTLFNAHHRLMFVKDKVHQYKLYYVQIFSSKENAQMSDKDFNYYIIQNGFDGKVYVQDLSNTITRKVDFINGVEVKPSITSKTDAEFEPFCVYLGYWYEDGHFEPIELLYCTVYDIDENMPYPVYAGGGTGGAGGGTNTPGYAAVPITTQEQFEDLVNGTDAVGYDITLELLGNTRLSAINSNVLPWAWVQYVVKTEKVGTNWQVIDLHSVLNGNVTNLKWEQVDYGVQVNTATNITYIHVIATLTSIVPMPIGPNNELAYNINYSIQVNTKTGRIIQADKM
ncbi:hypothetical protein [Flavobacterium anhuiense]|uniref:hypothetical protein n=1 Tax=Flavobacterium anhuiense TaxID=459526 RepID=UPI00202720A1|nr:hypothetical protein [Flavobacterium anhuiense]URM35264.1 hypothetical protein LLY39_12455 [Flavobacterium anhuiense]